MGYERGDVGGCMRGRLQTCKTSSAQTDAVVMVKCYVVTTFVSSVQ